MRALTANRLADGEVVFWAGGVWVERFSEAEIFDDDDAAIARVRALAEMTLGHIIMTCEMLMLPGQAQAFEYEMGRSYFTYPIEPLPEWDPAEARARHLADGEAVFGSMLETFLDGIKAGAPKP